MTFDQHDIFIKEGIKTFEEQIKKLKEKEKEKDNSKEIEIENKNYDNYDIIIDNDINLNDKIKLKNNDIIKNKNSNNIEKKQIKLTDNNIDKINYNKDKNTNKKLLGLKRKNVPNYVKDRLIKNLILSLDNFIYDKRGITICEYDSFFKEINSTKSQIQIYTNDLDVSLYLI